VGKAELSRCPPSLTFNLETLAAQVEKTLELVWRGMVGRVDEKFARRIFHYLCSQGDEVVKFVRRDQGGFAPAIVYFQRPFG
jgi:hypothetical protein